MKAVVSAAAAAVALASSAFAADPDAATHRYLIERTFPKGALAGLDAATKKKVNDNNSTLGVAWEKSYANADLTKTYCMYTGPSEASIHAAAKSNGLPVDSIVEIPTDIDAEPKGHVQPIAAGQHRYLVTRTTPTARFMASNVLANLEANEAKFGVKILTSYASADPAKSFWVYEAKSADDVAKAAQSSGAPVDSIAEIPETLLPY